MELLSSKRIIQLKRVYAAVNNVVDLLENNCNISNFDPFCLSQKYGSEIQSSRVIGKRHKGEHNSLNFSGVGHLVLRKLFIDFCKNEQVQQKETLADTLFVMTFLRDKHTLLS